MGISRVIAGAEFNGVDVKALEFFEDLLQRE
jgi:hypothetical protein